MDTSNQLANGSFGIIRKGTNSLIIIYLLKNLNLILSFYFLDILHSNNFI